MYFDTPERFPFAHGDIYVLCFTCSLLNCPLLGDNGQFDNGKIL